MLITESLEKAGRKAGGTANSRKESREAVIRCLAKQILAADPRVPGLEASTVAELGFL